MGAEATGGGWHGGHRGKWHGGHGWGGPRVGIGIGLGTFWGPYWGLYWGGYWRPYAYGYPYGSPYAYAYPPVVAALSTQVYLQPAPQASVQPPPPVYWYYCDEAAGITPTCSNVQGAGGRWPPRHRKQRLNTAA
jgi:hypothetical protein